ncbi:MAG: hypothetical protein ACR2J5_14310, partial [Geodermatophilaceae bacterium]
MCVTCGCGDPAGVRVRTPGTTAVDHHDHPHDLGHQPHDHGHPHNHDHPHDHLHDHDHPPVRAATRTIAIEQELLAKNDALAEHNRNWLAEHRIVAINLMSSPGSGKTTLLERTIREAGAGRT